MGGKSQKKKELYCWFLSIFISTAYAYDLLDPYGNVTIKWDVMHEHDATQDVRVSIFNYQLYRHIDPPSPGWRLTWTWNTTNEVIWDMRGAEAAEQGDCSRFKGHTLPHCCQQNPVIIDLLPGAPYNKQVANCCKGGVLSSVLQDIDKSVASFQMSIGISSLVTNRDGKSNATFSIPKNLQLGVPGYTCGDPPVQVPPSKFFEDQGRRTTQALRTWNITCTYSQFTASPKPTCCVSLSSFYDENIISCPTCSCGCRTLENQCVEAGEEVPPALQLQPNDGATVKPVVQCTQHMCPVRVHWHVKQSYREYWRVKMTVTNFNYVKNYSQWSVVVQHPNLKSVVQVFSFNYKPLDQVETNDSGIFYGLKLYNDMLIQSGQYGNVQTEMLLRKDAEMFTFDDGWAFPRRIMFNGDQCVMPQADEYPMLPNSSPRQFSSRLSLFAIVLSLFLYM